MWARRSVSKFVSGSSSCKTSLALTSSPSGSGISWSSRKLHTTIFKQSGETLQYSRNVTASLFSKIQSHNRIAGYVVFCRNESTIPPLHSEVFSKQVEQHSASSLATSTNAASGSETLLTTASTSSTGNTLSSSINSTTPTETLSASSTPTSAVAEQPLTWENIPEPPPVPVEELVSELVLSSNGEPTFTSLGLGGWSPSGMVQQCLEYAHVEFGLPWWSAIMLGVVCVRLLVFPLVVKSQRNAAKMANNMPGMQALQLKMSEARQTGNALMAAKYGQDLMVFMKEKDISPFKNLLVPIAMAPIFISFFFGLRKMANLPVESMKEGGLFWFTDLTLADPYFILPILTSVTMWITLEVGVDGVQLNASQHGQVMRYFIRAVPFIMVPLTMNFPAAILCYWCSTNAVSLLQVSVMKLPAVRSKLKIEQIRRYSPDSLPIKKKPFLESVKDSWTNVKITKEMEDRVRYDEMSFKRAGRGPIPKTYKYDPTKSSPSLPVTAIQAKQKP